MPTTNSKPKGYVPSYLEAGGEKELCVVCGDAASGLHYRCMTCEGCKGFFRRTIQKELVYHCKGAGNCPIGNKETRNHCQDCRFRKALSVGMAKDLVLTDSARRAKRALIEENRERRALKDLRNTIKSIEAEPEMNVLSDHDSHLLQALTYSFKTFLHLTQSQVLKMEGDEEVSVESVIVPHIQRIVSFAESFSAFANLGRDDRVLLVKGGWLELLVLGLCLGSEAAGEDVEVVELRRLLHRLKLDPTEAALMATLLLLNPERPGLRDSLLVESAQDELLTALSRYHSKITPRHHHYLLAIVHFRGQCSVLNDELTTKGQLPLLNRIHPLAPSQ